MADFAMCTSAQCNHAETCLHHERSRTVPDDRFQTYFDPSQREGSNTDTCPTYDPIVSIRRALSGVYGGRGLL